MGGSIYVPHRVRCKHDIFIESEYQFSMLLGERGIFPETLTNKVIKKIPADSV
jgi:hypothetical protein